MTTGDALLAAIWERPHDDLPRLAYADWLDDQGAPEQTARAEFIRVQCELARLDEWDDVREPLEKRAAALWRKWGKGWKARLSESLRKIVSFHRGFPAPRPLTLTVPAFLRRTAEEWVAAPLWDVAVTADPRKVSDLLASPHLARVGRLRLGFSDRVDDADIGRRLADCPGLRNVHTLSLWAGPTAFAPVSGVGQLTALRRLKLGHSDALYDDALTALAESPLADRLEDLDAKHCPVHTVGLLALCRSRRLVHLRRLDALDASFVHIGRKTDAAGPLLDALMASRPAFRLRELCFDRIAPPVAVRWADWTGLADVRRLILIGYRSDVQRSAGLLRSPQLAELRSLQLVVNDVPRGECKVLDELAKPDLLPSLRQLEVFGQLDAERTRSLRERFGSRLLVRVGWTDSTASPFL